MSNAETFCEFFRGDPIGTRCACCIAFGNSDPRQDDKSVWTLSDGSQIVIDGNVVYWSIGETWEVNPVVRS